MSTDLIEMIGNDSRTGHIRVRLDLELPHEHALQILQIVQAFKDRQQKETKIRLRQEKAEREKAEAAARKAAKVEAEKAKKSESAKTDGAESG